MSRDLAFREDCASAFPAQPHRHPLLLPRRQRSLQGPQDYTKGGDRPGGVGELAQRHPPPLRQALNRTHRG
jgi:hypothetical protein